MSKHAPPNMTPIMSGWRNGIEWCIVRAPLYGAVNGYVKIPEDHPWYGKSYDEIDADVHGGLTYGSQDGWIGFDTLHSGDYWPDMPDEPHFQYANRFWTEIDVKLETKRLALQVAAYYESRDA